MDHYLLHQTELINLKTKRFIVLNIQHMYTYNMKTGTYDDVIACGFFDPTRKDKVTVTSMLFPSERAFANMLDFIDRNPTYQLEDLHKFKQ